MASPAPCQACLESPDSEFCVTNRLGVAWPYEQAVVNLCYRCFLNLAAQLMEAIQAAMAELEAMQEPPVLEQIEADEGKAPVTPSKSKRRPRKTTATPVHVIEPEAPQETEAPDVES